MQKSRRHHAVAALGGAGLLLAMTSPAFAAWPATGILEINPSISNTRVVALKDSAMLKRTPTSSEFEALNAVVDGARVAANMDAMAMQLAERPTADEAWRTIFRSSKEWSATRVAIKVNGISWENTARLAVVEKFTTTLVGLGIPARNIVIYDGCSGAVLFDPYFSPTDPSLAPGVVSNLSDSLGGTKSTPLPGGGTGECTADIADGKIDILINIANNKGHTDMGRATLCMKNHYGTFAPRHDVDVHPYVFNINKSDAIIGGDPVRQQLCFIDSLFANKVDMSGPVEAMPGYLVMGTFAPIVDYLTVKKVREEVMKATHDSAIINSYLTSFGYTTDDPVWISVPPVGTVPGTGGSTGTGTGGAPGTGGEPGTGGTPGTGGAPGTGGTRNGGAVGTGGARNGGAPGTGGAKTGGAVGTGGVRNGGAVGVGGAGARPPGSGGAKLGGAIGAGGLGTMTPGNGGAKVGGAIGVGGAAIGGVPGNGGAVMGGGPGMGGSTSGHTGPGDAAAANPAAPDASTWGDDGGAKPHKSSGGCRVAAADDSAMGLALLIVLGALLAGQHRRPESRPKR